MAKKLKEEQILPDDVLETILSKLPLKSLVRFKTVCRSWRALISDSSRFSENYSIQNSKSQKLFLIRRSKPHLRWGVFALVEFENRKFRIPSMLGNPIGDWIPVCSCNGIVLLRTPNNNVFTLWNPTLRKYSRVWLEDFVDDSSIYHGLYHDSRTDDYKIAVVGLKHYTVFSCKTGTWARKKPIPTPSTRCFTVFFDGSFYWWDRDQGKLMCSSFADDKFMTLEHPDDLKANYNVNLIILSGRLCLYYSSSKDTKTKLQLWVMEKNGDENYSCWELMSAEIEMPHPPITMPVCLTNEDDVVLRMMGSNYVVYNHNDKRFEKKRIFKGLFHSQLILCSDSLVFPIQNFNSH